MMKLKSSNHIFVSFLLCFYASLFLSSSASDFIVPNSGGEPVVIDISGLNVTGGVDVSIGEFTNQPRTYRDLNTKSIVVFPPAAGDSEKTLQLSVGSTTISKTVSFRSSPQGSLKNSLIPILQKGRGGHTATKISDGRIVLVGGSKEIANNSLSFVEIFNPETAKTELLKSPDGKNKAILNIPRSQHSATYLGISNSPLGMIEGPVEQILVAGGFSGEGGLENSLEIVEIKSGTNQAVSTLLDGKKSHLKKARIFHTASVLPDGRILIVGGQGRLSMSALGALNSIEIFDPVTKIVSLATTSLSTARLLHTATTLQNGNILIAGGFTNEKLGDFGIGPAISGAELFDVASLSIRDAGALNVAVGGHSDNLLTNGSVLFTGGSSAFFASKDQDAIQGLATGIIQYFDNKAGDFKRVLDSAAGTSLSLQVSRFLHRTVLLPNNTFAIIGGLNVKSSGDLAGFINTPVSKIEVFKIDALSLQGGNIKALQDTSFDSSVGRVFPSASLVTPKNKTYGFLTASDSAKFINSAVYIAGGFTNGSGRLPTNINELLQIESNVGAEGRSLKLTPQGVIQGSFLNSLLVQLDDFIKVPSLKVEPQTINLSSSNNFIATTKVISSGGETILLKAEISDPNNSVIVSPSLFQTGNEITITRKDSSVSGEFEVIISPVDATGNFIPVRVKVNVSNSAKPFLATVPGFGVSLSTQNTNNSQAIQLKVFSQDGKTELTSIPSNTEVTGIIDDPAVANLGGTEVSSVKGSLNTQFIVNAVMPGKTLLNFSINFPDVLPVRIPIEVIGTPVFSDSPVDSSILSPLLATGIEFSDIMLLDSFTVSVNDFRLPSVGSLFPVYVPVGLISSIDGSMLTGQFTIRPLFGIDLSTAIPRTLVDIQKLIFSPSLGKITKALTGFVSDENAFAAVAFSDGIRTVNYSSDPSAVIEDSLKGISMIDGADDLKIFKFGSSESLKIAVLKESKLIIIDLENGQVETSFSLSANGKEVKLVNVNGDIAAVILNQKGIDFILPITDASPRIVNFKNSAALISLAVAEKLNNQIGPFAITYDNSNTISIRNLINIDDPIKNIAVNEGKLYEINYAGRFTVNGQATDVLIAVSDRDIALYDLNNLTSIPFNESLDIKSKIEDIVVIDGIAYLALGDDGVWALSVGGLIDNNKSAEIARFTKNKFSVVNINGKEVIKTKKFNAKLLADSNPFLLVSGSDNDLTVIKVVP